MLKNFIKRSNHVINGVDGKGEDAASNLEILVWMFVVLGIATFLWLFRDKVGELLGKVMDSMDSWKVDEGH